jgi:hypothetical protein
LSAAIAGIFNGSASSGVDDAEVHDPVGGRASRLFAAA